MVKIPKYSRDGITAFLSHNKADKETARLLAMALVEQGVNVWFDEWAIRPGESITGGIEDGLASADIFVLVWSASASKSSWVGTEVRAYLRRRVDDKSLRIVPVMIDATPLPVLVADYRGFKVEEATRLSAIAFEITGHPSDTETARRLQDRLMELTEGNASTGDPLPYLICPTCGSPKLERSTHTDHERQDEYYVIQCPKCKWSDASQI